ncbi:MAG: hypothetical protein ACRC6A_10015 [Fusobacteriaceae bacterium]
MILFEKIENIISNSNNTKKGIAFIGDNSGGKTYIMEACVNKLKSEYKIIYIPENCQDLDVINHTESIGDNTRVFSKKTELTSLKKIYENRISQKIDGSPRIQHAQKIDDEAIIISKILAETNPENLLKFFDEKLNFNLDFSKVPMEISISNQPMSILTSSGYKAMIKIASEIFFYMSENVEHKEKVLIFIDEIDSKFYWTNREKYFKYLEEFIRGQFKNKEILFIISSHMSETVANLPEGYSIIKMFAKKGEDIEYKEYESNDFLNQEQIDRIIFDKTTEVFKESENLIILKNLYFNIIKNKHMNHNWTKDAISIENISYIYTIFGNSITIIKDYCYSYDIMYYNNLSIKERIIFNSIKQLLGWG